MPKMIKCECLECGKKFERPPWKVKKGNAKYCSRQCGCRAAGKKNKGRDPWNTGLPKDDPRIASKIAKQTETMRKRYNSGDLKAWNTGLTKETDKRVADYVTKQTKIRNTEGEWKDNWKKAISVGQVRAYAKGKYGNKDTKPELLTKAHLESLGFVVKPYSEKSDSDPVDCWYQQYNFEDAFVPDFAFSSKNLIIEVNGCAIHGHDVEKCNHPKLKYGWTPLADRNRKRDRKKYSMYYRHGWKYAIVWECEAEDGDFHRLEKYLDL